MRSRHFLSSSLLLLALLLAVATVCMAAMAVNAPERSVKAPEGAVERVEALMGAAARGDLEGVSANLYGTPALGPLPDQADPTMAMIWGAYCGSISLQSVGQTRAEGAGLSMDVTVRCLDMNAVLEGVSSRSGDLERVVTDALDDPACYQERTIPIGFVFENGQWWVQPNGELTDLLSGSVSK